MSKLFCGIDLGTRSSCFCIVNEQRQVVQRWSGRTDRLVLELSLVSVKLRCVVEASPLAETVCGEVEKFGGEIEIVDSRHTKALLHGKKKTDRVDAETLAELALLGWYKPIYRKGGKCREQRSVVSGRATLVNISTQLKNTMRGLLKSFGIVLPASCEGVRFERAVRIAIKPLATEVQRTIEELLAVWVDVYERQKRGYKNLARIAKADVVALRLMSVPGVGPATALAFVSTIANPARFKDAKQVAGYLGLAPKVHQSGDIHFHGRITRKGDKLTRWLLVEAAGVILTRVRTSFPLREWGLALAQKKGTAKAKVAVARRLSILLFTLWKTEKDFQLQSA